MLTLNIWQTLLLESSNNSQTSNFHPLKCSSFCLLSREIVLIWQGYLWPATIFFISIGHHVRQMELTLLVHLSRLCLRDGLTTREWSLLLGWKRSVRVAYHGLVVQLVAPLGKERARLLLREAAKWNCRLWRRHLNQWLTLNQGLLLSLDWMVSSISVASWAIINDPLPPVNTHTGLTLKKNIVAYSENSSCCW